MFILVLHPYAGIIRIRYYGSRVKTLLSAQTTELPEVDIHFQF
jgi:hypothetical protein